MSKKPKNKSEYIEILNFWFAYANCIPYIYSQKKDFNEKKCNSNVLKNKYAIASYFGFLVLFIVIGLAMFTELFEFSKSVSVCRNHSHVVCYDENDTEKRNGEYYHRENKTLLRKSRNQNCQRCNNKSIDSKQGRP